MLDVNVIRDFFPRPNKPGRTEDKCSTDRTALEVAITAGVLAIVATNPLWHELTEFHSGHGDPELWRKVARWFLSISPSLGLRTLHARSQLELVVKRPLLDHEAFKSLDVGRMAAAIDDDQLVIATHAEQRDEKVGDLAEQLRMRRATLKGLREHSQAWRQELQAAYETKHALIQQYVREQIEADVAKGILSHDGEWPADLRAFRSAYFREAFYVERAHWVFVEERLQDPTSARSIKRTPDIYDSTHFADAAYADVFVTGDSILALLAKKTGLITVWSQDELLEWARSSPLPPRPVAGRR